MYTYWKKTYSTHADYQIIEILVSGFIFTNDNSVLSHRRNSSFNAVTASAFSHKKQLQEYYWQNTLYAFMVYCELLNVYKRTLFHVVLNSVHWWQWQWQWQYTFRKNIFSKAYTSASSPFGSGLHISARLVTFWLSLLCVFLQVEGCCCVSR